MDWHSGRVLSWRLGNAIAQRSPGGMSAKPTRDVAFCTDALEEALARHGKPGVLDSGQGSQSTSLAFAPALTDAGIQVIPTALCPDFSPSLRPVVASRVCGAAIQDCKDPAGGPGLPRRKGGSQ